MIKKLRLESCIWFFLSIFLGNESIHLNLGTFRSPGPGFVPFMLALFLFLLSLILFIQDNLFQKERSVPGSGFKMNAFYIICFIFGYVFLFKKLGYLFSTLLLMTFIFRFMGMKRWMWALGSGILVTFVSYLFFGVLLQLNLPSGIF